MKMKQKLIVCTLILIAGSAFGLFFSTILHKLLSRQINVIQLIPLEECIKSLVESKQHQMLFFCFFGFVAILSVMYYLTNLRPYQSDLDEITPEIKTPKAVGQYQHGSSRWLNEKELEKAFDSFVLDPEDGTVKELLNDGYDDMEIIEKDNNTEGN